MHQYSATLETGDVLLFKRGGVLGWGITLFTGGECCHAEIVVNGWGRHWSIGAGATGIAMRPVSSLLLTKERLRVRRIPEAHTPPDGWRDALTEFAIAAVGVWEYDFAAFAGNAFAALFGPPSKRDPSKMPNRVICSEWCSLLLRQFARFDPCPERPDKWTTPNDLDTKSRLVTVCDELRFADTPGG